MISNIAVMTVRYFIGWVEISLTPGLVKFIFKNIILF